MADDRTNLVMCATCEERVAELVAEDGRTLCSLCQLEEMDAPSGSNAGGDGTDDE